MGGVETKKSPTDQGLYSRPPSSYHSCFIHLFITSRPSLPQVFCGSLLGRRAIPLISNLSITTCGPAPQISPSCHVKACDSSSPPLPSTSPRTWLEPTAAVAAASISLTSWRNSPRSMSPSLTSKMTRASRCFPIPHGSTSTWASRWMAPTATVKDLRAALPLSGRR